MSGFTLVVGLGALGIGLSEITGLDLPVLPILLVAIGAYILYEESRRHGTPTHA
jgi:hypothetical protein